jgi:DNA-binding CsgD family transcriptional regulator
VDVTDVFVGRAAELATLATELRLAASGQGRTVVVSGPPGVGKSRLVHQALGGGDGHVDGHVDGHEGDRVVLHGGCVDRPGPHYPSVPFAPFVEALRRLRGTGAPPEVLAAARAWVRPDAPGRLALGIGTGTGTSTDTSPGEDQVYRRFTEMLDVLEAAAEWRPLVVLVDDLQWADPSSLALLVFLARSVTTERILLAATLRDTAPSVHEHLDRALAELRRAPAVRWLTLDRLPDDDVAALVHAIRGPATPEREVRAVVRRAEGNALAAAELAQHRGADDDLPRSYAGAVAARLAGLSPGALDVLRVVATAGRAVEPELIARLVAALRTQVPAAETDLPAAPDLSAEPAEHDRSLEEAVRSGLLVRSGAAYGLRHGLDREAVYRGIPPWLGRRLHGLVARELARVPGAPSPERLAEVADHWSRSGDETAAFDACLAAGRAAAGVRAFPEAVALLRRALGHRDRLEPPLADAPPAAAEVRLELAEALRLAGDVDGGIALLEDTLRGPATSEVVARCWERLGWFHRETGDGERANLAYRHALEAVGTSGDTPTRARVLASHAAALMIFGSLDEAGRRAQEALAVAGTAGSHTARASALDTWGVVAALRGDPDEGLRALAEARDVAVTCGSEDELWRAVSNTAYVLQNIGREEESVEVVTRAVAEVGDDRPHPPAAVTAVGNAVSALILLGRWDEALEWIAWCSARRPPAGLAAHIAFTEAEVRVYRDDDAPRALAAAHVLVDRSAEPELVAALWRVHAEHLAWHGRTVEARAAVDRSVEALSRSDDPESLLGVLTVGLRVEADATALPGGADAARLDHLSRLAASVATASADESPDQPAQELPDVRLGSALCAAETARAHGDGTQAWSAVVTLARQLDRPYRLAYALLRLAEHELTTGGRRRASEHLAEAHAVAQGLSAAPLAGAVEAVVRRARLTLAAPGTAEATPPAAAPFGLTVRELEVLRLLADGASNRQIARSLFISERTAAVHVSHILAKLQAGSRQQAAAAAYRAGLLATR